MVFYYLANLSYRVLELRFILIQEHSKPSVLDNGTGFKTIMSGTHQTVKPQSLFFIISF